MERIYGKGGYLRKKGEFEECKRSLGRI